MATAQKDHDNAVRIKDNANGWLSGAPLAAEQADVAQSQQLTQEAIQQQQQLNNMEGGALRMVTRLGSAAPTPAPGTASC